MTITQKRRSKVALAAATIFVFTLGASSALGDIANYNITNSNLGSGFTGPFGTVQVNLTSAGNATVTFTSDNNGSFIYLMGGNQGVAVDVTGTATVGSTPTATYVAGFGPATLTPSGSVAMDGFGTFADSVSFSDGFTSAAKSVTFTLAQTSGTTWTSASQVITDAAFHAFACADTCTPGEGAAATGFVASLSPVPEPGVLSLTGLLGGLIGFVAYRRRSTVNE